MGVRRKLLRDLLAQLKIIRNLSEQQISASLWRGQATFSNLELEPRLIQELLLDIWPLGLEILEAHVDELTVRIPWSQLMAQSTIVVARNIEIRAAVHCDDESDWKDVIAAAMRRVVQAQRDQVNNAPYNAGPSGALEQLRQRVVDGLQLQVGRVRLSLWSRHERHKSSRHTPCEASEDGPSEAEFEEVLVLCGEDILLSPCDSGRVPSDQLKNMALFFPQERALQLTKLLKCGGFRVSPPVRRHAETESGDSLQEYMDTAAILNIFIVMRLPSDGTYLCPFPLTTEIHVDLPNPLNVQISEKQMQALFSLLGDVAALEEWRLDDNFLRIGGGRQIQASSDSNEVLMNTSDVSRTFARGTPKDPPKTSETSKRSPPGLAAGVWHRVWRPQAERDKAVHQVSPGFHPVDVDKLANLSDRPVASIAASSPERADAHSPASCSTGPGCASGEVVGVSEGTPAGGPLLHPADTKANEEVEEDEDDDMYDVEEDDYFSVASDEVVSPGHNTSRETGKSRKSLVSKVKTWFGSKVLQQPEVEDWPEMEKFRSMLQVSVGNLTVQVNSIETEGNDITDSAHIEVERFSWRTECSLLFTDFQAECIRRLAALARPVEAAQAALETWNSTVGTVSLPTLVDASTEMSGHRGFLLFGPADAETEMLRSREDELRVNHRPMLHLTMRPRTAPPVSLEERAVNFGGRLRNWPVDAQVHRACITIDQVAWTAALQFWLRLQPCLLAKNAPPALLAPDAPHDSSPGVTPVDGSSELFPGECLSVDIVECEVIEPCEARVIAAEERWPWHAEMPRLMLRSRSDKWDLSQALACDGGRSISSPCTPSPRGRLSSSSAAAEPPDGMVTLPKEMFDQLVQRAAEVTQKEAQVSAAREELQRAYIQVAAARSSAKAHVHGDGHGAEQRGATSSQTGTVSTPVPASVAAGALEAENERLRRRCAQLESSAEALALGQRRLEAELLHHQAHARNALSNIMLRSASKKDTMLQVQKSTK